MSELDRSQEQPATTSQCPALGNLLSQATVEASLLQHDSELLRSARPEALSLPIVHAAVVVGASGVRAIAAGSATKEVAFTPHALHVSSHAATLTSHITQEETSLPLSAVFDIFPVPRAEGSEELFNSAPTPHLLQVLSVVPNGVPTGGAAGELTVTLALPSVAECSRLTSTLARCREAILSKEPATLPKAAATSKLITSSSAALTPITNGTSVAGSSSGPSSAVRQNWSERGLSDASQGLVNFTSLHIKAVPLFKAWGPGSAVASAAVPEGYKPCSVQLNSHGLLIELSSASSVGPEPGPWALPWSSVLEARAVEGASPDAPAAMRENTQVVRIVVSYRTGLTGNTWCTLNLSSELPGQTQSFLRALQAHQPNAVPSEWPLRHILNEIPGAPSMGATAAAPPGGGPPQSRVSAQVSAVGAPPGGTMKDNEPLHVVHIDNVPVPLTATMANLLMNYQPEDSEQPDPLFLSPVWIALLSTGGGFRRSAVCVDKLGLTITPLVRADSLSEAAKLGAQETATLREARCSSGMGRSRQDDDSPQGEVALMTETLNFPISAVVDVAEETEFKAVSSAEPAASQAAGSGGSGAGASTGAGGSSASDSGTGKRRAAPFQRTMGPWGEKASGDQLKPPHPHLVGLRVKGALAGRVNGPDKTPIQMRLNAQPPPPVAMVLCFSDKDKSLQFISRMLAFKKYQLSVALSTYLNTLTAVSQRQSERRGLRAVEEGVVAQRMLGQVVTPSLEPPPLPPRPSDLPPPSRLPRMVTNDEGEVFWYIPRKQPQPMRPQKNANMQRPVAPPNPDSEPLNSPPELQPDQAKLADFLGNSSTDNVRLQTPRKAAVKIGALSGQLQGNASASVTPVPPATPTPLAAGIDDDLPVADTPAPCLVSPTPSPGRRISGTGS